MTPTRAGPGANDLSPSSPGGGGLSAFFAELDPAIVAVDRVQAALHAFDATNEFHFPAAVVRPRNGDEIRMVVAAAAVHRVPLFPRGAGTGFSGGSVPSAGGVVLDLLALNRILDLDEQEMTVLVEPGVITGYLQQYVERRGLYYPPDPASLKTCTIGGNVAENAGGPHCLKYGVTRDYVLALSGFTGTGAPFTAGKGILKNRAGYDLRHLLIGSEGTLAVFSSILLRLIPKPETRILFAAFFNDLDAATEMVGTLLRRGLMPSSLEFMDDRTLAAVEQHARLGLPIDAQALLLIEVDGRADEMPRLRGLVEDCLVGVAREVRYATTAAAQDSLWEIRRRASPAMRAYGNRKANEDISVPRRHVPAVMRGLKAIAHKHALNIINFGHIGDGNIHVNIMFNGDDSKECARVKLAIVEVFALANRFGGAISGEHGIGLAKKPYLAGNLDPVSYELMRRIKRVFDPHGILNPGKMLIFPEDSPDTLSGGAKHPREGADA
jgi:glycolate oxidase